MKQGKTTEKEIKKMLEEATVDCYGEYEEFTGIFCYLADNMSFPFKAMVLGDEIEVIGLDEDRSSIGRGLITKILKNDNEYKIDLAELETNNTKNKKFLEMYKYWIGNF